MEQIEIIDLSNYDMSSGIPVLKPTITYTGITWRAIQDGIVITAKKTDEECARLCQKLCGKALANALEDWIENISEYGMVIDAEGEQEQVS